MEDVIVKLILFKVDHQSIEQATLLDPEFWLELKFEAHFEHVVTIASDLAHRRCLNVE
jgi:hypothetical protein